MNKARNRVWIAAIIGGALILSTFFDGNSAEDEQEPASTPSAVEVATRTITPEPSRPRPEPVGEEEDSSPPDGIESSSSIQGEHPRTSQERLLARQARRFLEAYYTIPHDATEQGMRTAVLGVGPVAPHFLKRLYFGVEETQQRQNLLRWKDRLTIRGSVHQDALLVQKSEGSVSTVEGLVTIVTEQPDGKQVDRIETRTATVWRYRSGKWILLGFADHSHEAGGDDVDKR